MVKLNLILKLTYWNQKRTTKRKFVIEKRRCIHLELFYQYLKKARI